MADADKMLVARIIGVCGCSAASSERSGLPHLTINEEFARVLQ